MPIHRYTPTQEYNVSQNAILFYAPYNIYFETFKLRRSITRYSVDRTIQRPLPAFVKPSKSYSEKDIITLIRTLVTNSGRDPVPAILDLLHFNHYQPLTPGGDGYEIYLVYRKLLMIAQGADIEALQQAQVDLVQQHLQAANLNAVARFNYVGESRKCSHYISVEFTRPDGHRDYSKPSFVLKPDLGLELYSIAQQSHVSTIMQGLAASAATVQIKQALAPILI